VRLANRYGDRTLKGVAWAGTVAPHQGEQTSKWTNQFAITILCRNFDLRYLIDV